MARKKYMAIHTFHSDEMKRAFFRGLHKSELTDFQWRDGYIFEKCQCTGTWVGDDDFFFCHWYAESEQVIIDKLASIGADDLFITMAVKTKKPIADTDELEKMRNQLLEKEK